MKLEHSHYLLASDEERDHIKATIFRIQERCIKLYQKYFYDFSTHYEYNEKEFLSEVESIKIRLPCIKKTNQGFSYLSMQEYDLLDFVYNKDLVSNHFDDIDELIRIKYQDKAEPKKRLLSIDMRISYIERDLNWDVYRPHRLSLLYILER